MIERLEKKSHSYGLNSYSFSSQHSAVSIQQSAFSSQHSAFSSQYSAVSIQQSAFSSQHSAVSIQHSAFSIQHSAVSIQQSAFSIRSELQYITVCYSWYFRLSVFSTFLILFTVLCSKHSDNITPSISNCSNYSFFVSFHSHKYLQSMQI